MLLTGSVSRGVFSQGVNHDGIEQATSVVMHDDGSFTLGGGDSDITLSNLEYWVASSISSISL